MHLGLGLKGYINNNYLLLDNYPELEFIYSIVRLVSSYKGPCLRVRKGTSNVDIPFTNKNLPNVASLIQFVGNDDGYLVGWYDQGRKSRHIFQDDTALQPKIISGGLFDPEGLIFSSDIFKLNSSWLANHESTIMVRETATTINTSNWFIGTETDLFNESITLGYADQNTLRATQFDSVINYDNPSTNFPLNTKRVWAATSTNTSSSGSKKVYLDGTLVASS
jgi:hypothetical protein